MHVARAITAVAHGAGVPGVVEALMGMRMGPPPRPTGASVGRDSAEDQAHKAWIEPNGRTHAVGKSETHLYWINDHHQTHLPPEMHKGAWYRESRDDDFKVLDSEKVANRMLKAGWIRKAAKDAYHVHERGQVPRVLAHVRRWHPEVDEFDVDVGPKALNTVRINAHTGWPVRR